MINPPTGPVVPVLPGWPPPKLLLRLKPGLRPSPSVRCRRHRSTTPPPQPAA